jgi:hypothetical protein
MSNLIYLLVAFALSGIGLVALWVRSRPSPASPRSSVEQFNEKMKALAPDADGGQRRTREKRGV